MVRYEESCYRCGSYDCVCDDGYHQEQEEHEQICGYGHLYYGTYCDECAHGDDESDRESVNDSSDDEEGEIRPSTIVMLGSYDLSKYYVDDETAEVS